MMKKLHKRIKHSAHQTKLCKSTSRGLAKISICTISLDERNIRAHRGEWVKRQNLPVENSLHFTRRLVHDGVNTTAVNKPKLLEWIGQNKYGLIYVVTY